MLLNRLDQLLLPFLFQAMPDEELNPITHLMKFIGVKIGIFCLRCDISLLKKKRIYFAKHCEFYR